MRIYRELFQHLETGEPNPEWLEVRKGKFTGSDFHQYLGVIDKGLSATADTSLAKKVLEGLDFEFDSYTNSIMQRGNELEPEARREYQAETFEDVQEIGFVDYEKLRAGCSPDGVIYTNGAITKIIEIKCPDIVNYLKYAKGYIKPEYKTQMQFNMLITGAEECDFVAYYPSMKLIINNVKADKEYQNKILSCLNELNDLYSKLEQDIRELKL